MRLLHMFVAAGVLYSDPIIAGSAKGKCVIEAEASIGMLDLEITECYVDGNYKVKAGMFSGTFKVDLTRLDAGWVPLRTSEMKSEKFLYVKKYPTATLKMKPVKYGGEQEFNGILTVRGMPKTVKGKIEFHGKKATAKFEVDTLDYKLPEMSHEGITLSNKLNVVVNISL